MKLKAVRRGADRSVSAYSGFAFKEPLLALSIAIPLMLGCRGEGKAAQPAQASSADREQVEIPHFIPSGPAYKGLPSQPSASPSMAPVTTPAPGAFPTGYIPTPGTCPPDRNDVRAGLVSSGHEKLLGIIDRRVSQERPKMKLTEQEGLSAACYVLSDLPAMPQAHALSERMPKTAIELLRSVNERGVTREDAEGMAGYLNSMLGSMQMRKLGTFDECCSHVLGRRWDQVDYSGERLDPHEQERHYASRGVPDLLTAEHVRRYFAVESKMPYFRRIFNPQGPLPEF